MRVCPEKSRVKSRMLVPESRLPGQRRVVAAAFQVGDDLTVLLDVRSRLPDVVLEALAGR